MEYRKLGRSDIDVSLICLGTMTWGEQNTEADAHDQLDYSLDHEVNLSILLKYMLFLQKLKLRV